MSNAHFRKAIQTIGITVKDDLWAKVANAANFRVALGENGILVSDVNWNTVMREAEKEGRSEHLNKLMNAKLNPAEWNLRGGRGYMRVDVPAYHAQRCMVPFMNGCIHIEREFVIATLIDRGPEVRNIGTPEEDRFFDITITFKEVCEFYDTISKDWQKKLRIFTEEALKLYREWQALQQGPFEIQEEVA